MLEEVFQGLLSRTTTGKSTLQPEFNAAYAKG